MDESGPARDQAAGVAGYCNAFSRPLQRNARIGAGISVDGEAPKRRVVDNAYGELKVVTSTAAA